MLHNILYFVCFVLCAILHACSIVCSFCNTWCSFHCMLSNMIKCIILKLSSAISRGAGREKLCNKQSMVHDVHSTAVIYAFALVRSCRYTEWWYLQYSMLHDNICIMCCILQLNLVCRRKFCSVLCEPITAEILCRDAAPDEKLFF